MTRKSIGLLSVAIACAAAVSISISSCNSNSTSPTTPGNGGVDRSKNPQVLGDGALAQVGSSTAGAAGTSVHYDDNAYLTATGPASGFDVTTTFDSPINTYRAAIDATFPGTGGSLTYAAQDDGGTEQARLSLASQNGVYQVYPTFTSHPDQGEGTPQYQVTFYDNNGQTCGPFTLRAADRITIIGDQSCIVKAGYVGWQAITVTGQCAFTLTLDPCCTYTFQLPDGTTCTGNIVKFTELNDKGVYVYIQTRSIRTTGTTTTYAVKSQSAFTS